MKQEGGGGTTALPGSVTASGRRGGGGGGGDFPRLLWDESVNGRGGGMHARGRGRAFTRRRRAPARHPRSVHHPDTHAAVGQRCTANQIKGGACVTSGGGVRCPRPEHTVRWEADKKGEASLSVI